MRHLVLSLMILFIWNYFAISVNVLAEDEINNHQTELESIKEGWVMKDNIWYYYQSNGSMSLGWTQVGSSWYYMNANGAMQTGWLKEGSTWYYLKPNGSMSLGWTQVGSNWYYMNANGAMQTGWLWKNNAWYYLQPNGSMSVGWTQVGSSWYYLNSNGAMQTGWLKEGNAWYYLQSNGSMSTGLITIRKQKYIFDLTGKWLPDALSVLSTKDLLLPNENSKIRTKSIKNITLHFTSNAIKKPKNPYNVFDIYNIFIDYGVSAHYMIGRNGELYFMVPENRVAYHAGKGSLPGYPEYKDRLNEYSIGIELMAIGTREEMGIMMSNTAYNQISKLDIGYTNAQYKTLNLLLDDITVRNPMVKRARTHIVGHDEYASGRKTDPGSLFQWNKIGLFR